MNSFCCMHIQTRESVFGNMLGGRDVHLEEWVLAYSPHNPVLEELMRKVVDSLVLTDKIGVNSSDELIDIIVDRELIAGVEFYHPSVNSFWLQLETN